MNEVQILFFALASFFGIEGGRIAAEKTTVTINPTEKKIEIFQEELFTIIKSKEDSLLFLEQWNKLINYKEKDWSKELDSFPVKNLVFNSDSNQPTLTFNYTREVDLWTMGIWYNKDQDLYSINDVESYNLKTNKGTLKNKYWYFKGDSTFCFTLEPFIEMSKEYKCFKQKITTLFKVKE